MDRRQAVTTIGLGVAGFATGTAFTAPACGVTKDKAVRYCTFAIGYLKDAAPLVGALGSQQLADLILSKAVPALEKLKAALESNDIPTSGTWFERIQTIMGEIATALLQLPDSPKRTVILGIIALVNLTLRTVDAFIQSEEPNAPVSPRMAAAPNAIRRAFEATRF